MRLRRFFSFLLLFAVSCTCQRQEKTFHVAVAQRLASQDPLFNLETDQLQALSLIYEGLLRYAPGSTELQPLLLKELPQVSADQLSYTFRLKDNVTFYTQKNFSRKMPLSSRDVILSWLRGLVGDPGSNYSVLLTGLIEGLEEWKMQPKGKGEWFGRELPRGIQVVSATEFQVKLKRKYPDFLAILTLPSLAVLPEEAFIPHSPLKFLPGTGPYFFSDTTTPDMWVLRPRNEKLPVVSVVSVTDRGHLKDFDVVFPSMRSSGEWVDNQLKSKSSLRVAELRPRRMEFLVFNTSDKAIKKLGKDFRKTLSQLLYRESIMGALYRIYGIPDFQFLPEGIEGRLDKLPEANTSTMSQLRDKLQKILKGSLTLLYPQTGEFWVQEIHRELGFLGTKLNFQSMDPTVYLGKIEKGDYQIAPISWEAEYPEATNYLQLFYRGQSNSQNFTRFYSSAYEELFEKMSRLFRSPERRALAEKANRLLLDEMPAIPLGFKREIVLLDETAKNYRNQDWGFWQLKDLLSGN